MLFLSCLSEINLINILSSLYGRLIFILKIISLQAIMSFVSGMRAGNRLTKPREVSFCGKFMRYECFPLPWLTAMLLSINMHSISVPILLWNAMRLWFQVKISTTFLSDIRNTYKSHGKFCFVWCIHAIPFKPAFQIFFEFLRI